MAEPIRILQVFAEMNRGGAETMIMNLYRHINREKIQFDFIVHTQEKCAFDDEIEQLGGRIYRVPKYAGTNHFAYKNAWKNFFKSYSDYNIIHGHVRSTASIYLKEARNFGLTTIAHSHNTSSGKGIRGIVKNIFQYNIRYISDYMFACSLDAGKWLFGKEIINSDRFSVINNAIETDKFIFNENVRDLKRKELNINNRIVIGHVGRFHPQKNHDFIIEIFNSIYLQNKNVVLLLVGDGDLRNKIENKARNLNLLNNVIFTGVRDDVNDLFQAMDVFLFPSKFEGLGIVAIEAQASGLPVIASDVLPKEVEISNLIKFISLNMNSEYWARNIIERLNVIKDRRNMKNEVIDSKYDIVYSANWLQDKYIMIYKNTR